MSRAGSVRPPMSKVSAIRLVAVGTDRRIRAGPWTGFVGVAQAMACGAAVEPGTHHPVFAPLATDVWTPVHHRSTIHPESAPFGYRASFAALIDPAASNR